MCVCVVCCVLCVVCCVRARARARAQCGSVLVGTQNTTHFRTLQTRVATTLVTYLVKIMLREFICDSEQVATRVRVSERTDTKAVGRIELSLEELTTNVLDLRELEQARRWQQCLHVALLNGHRRRVTEVNEEFHRGLVDVTNRHLRLPTLGKFTSEHSVEVRTTRRQDDTVGEDLALADEEDDVAQFALLTQHVDGLDRVTRVFVGVVRQTGGGRRPLKVRVKRTHV